MLVGCESEGYEDNAAVLSSERNVKTDNVCVLTDHISSKVAVILRVKMIHQFYSHLTSYAHTQGHDDTSLFLLFVAILKIIYLTTVLLVFIKLYFIKATKGCFGHVIICHLTNWWLNLNLLSRLCCFFFDYLLGE